MQWSGSDGLSDQPDVLPSSASITAQPASGALAAHMHSFLIARVLVYIAVCAVSKVCVCTVNGCTMLQL